VDEKDEPKDEPAAEQPAAPEPGPERPSALAAWRPGSAVSEPDDVGEVHAVEDVTREEALAAARAAGAESEPQEAALESAGAGSEEPNDDLQPALPGVEPPSDAGAPASEAPADEPSVLPAPQVRAVIEALVFASPHPITPKEIARVLQGVPKEFWQQELAGLCADYARDERGLQVVEVAGGYQITTRPEYNDWVRELLDPRTPTRLSIQALETLAVIAYKQPVTLPEIIELRGVKSGGVVKTLLEKRLIRITGRKEVVGRPILYGTTKQFLLHFGLKSLEELPKIEEFAEVLGEEVDIAGLKRAIESPLPVQVGLSDPDGEQIPLFEVPAPPQGVPLDGASLPGVDEAPSEEEPGGDPGPGDDDPTTA
jgi:segregation and condensation protein B